MSSDDVEIRVHSVPVLPEIRSAWEKLRPLLPKLSPEEQLLADRLAAAEDRAFLFGSGSPIE